MKLKINLAEVKNVLGDFEITKSQGKAIAGLVRQQIINTFYNNLVIAAKKKLRSTRGQYIAGINIRNNVVFLQGFLPNAIESGLSGRDMKQFFKNSNKVKFTKKGGWYLTIPFRFTTPNSSGVNFQKMPVDVYRIVKNKGVFTASDSKSPEKYSTTKTRNAFTDLLSKTTFPQSQNKTNNLEGLRKTSGSGGKSTYNTFRRVGSKSSPDSWISRGIIAHNLFDQAWKGTDVNGIINENIDNLLG
jgi:hypothetical protein